MYLLNEPALWNTVVDLVYIVDNGVLSYSLRFPSVSSYDSPLTAVLWLRAYFVSIICEVSIAPDWCALI